MLNFTWCLTQSLAMSSLLSRFSIFAQYSASVFITNELKFYGIFFFLIYYSGCAHVLEGLDKSIQCEASQIQFSVSSLNTFLEFSIVT